MLETILIVIIVVWFFKHYKIKLVKKNDKKD